MKTITITCDICGTKDGVGYINYKLPCREASGTDTRLDLCRGCCETMYDVINFVVRKKGLVKHDQLPRCSTCIKNRHPSHACEYSFSGAGLENIPNGCFDYISKDDKIIKFFQGVQE